MFVPTATNTPLIPPMARPLSRSFRSVRHAPCYGGSSWWLLPDAGLRGHLVGNLQPPSTWPAGLARWPRPCSHRIINLTCTVLLNADPALRKDLLLDLATLEGIRIYPAERQVALRRSEDSALMHMADPRSVSNSGRRRASRPSWEGLPGFALPHPRRRSRGRRRVLGHAARGAGHAPPHPEWSAGGLCVVPGPAWGLPDRVALLEPPSRI